MVGAIGSGLSGVNAYKTVLDVAGKNVANSASEGYKAERVEMTPQQGGGVSTEVTRSTVPGAQVMKEKGGQMELVEMSNVNLAEEMVGMITAERGAEANMNTIRTADQMLGTLLDMVG